MAVRTMAKGEQARAEILAAHPAAKLDIRRLDLAGRRRWNLMSNAAHPGFTRTNLQTAGANLGRDKPKRTPFNSPSILSPQDATAIRLWTEAERLTGVSLAASRARP